MSDSEGEDSVDEMTAQARVDMLETQYRVEKLRARMKERQAKLSKSSPPHAKSSKSSKSSSVPSTGSMSPPVSVSGERRLSDSRSASPADARAPVKAPIPAKTVAQLRQSEPPQGQGSGHSRSSSMGAISSSSAPSPPPPPPSMALSHSEAVLTAAMFGEPSSNPNFEMTDSKKEKSKKKEKVDTSRGVNTPGAETLFEALLRLPLKDFKTVIREAEPIKRGDPASTLVKKDPATGLALIHVAAKGHYFDQLHLIIKRDSAQVNLLTNSLETPLHSLCRSSTDVPSDRIPQLKSALADLGKSLCEKQNNHGETPLMIAIGANALNLATTLLTQAEPCEIHRAFVPFFINAPCLASSSAVSLYEIILKQRAARIDKWKLVTLFDVAHTRAKGEHPRQICSQNHPRELITGSSEPVKSGDRLESFRCGMCGDRMPTLYTRWHDSFCKFSACAACMPPPLTEDIIHMWKVFNALVPEDLRTLTSWYPLQELARLSHTRSRTIVEWHGKYYLPFETRGGTVARLGEMTDEFELVNLGETEAEWRIAAMHPTAETMAKEKLSVELTKGDRVLHDGRISRDKFTRLNITVKSAAPGVKRVRQVIAIATNPVKQVDLIFFFIDTRVTNPGIGERSAGALRASAAPAPKAAPHELGSGTGSIPIRRLKTDPGACPPGGAERGMLIEYCISGDEPHWLAERVWVRMEKEPLAAGNLREAFKTKLWRSGELSEWVTKINKMPEDHNRRAYELDVITQTMSSSFTHRYNSKKSLSFPNIAITAAYLLEFVDRDGAPVYAIERFMPGEYLKFNNNYGWSGVKKMSGSPSSPAEADALQIAQWTAAAFSHFTFLESRGKLMVVDIQGVGQNYTDPQIHTANGVGYGKGNQGINGIEMFKSTHVCNPICKDMGIAKNWSVESSRATRK